MNRKILLMAAAGAALGVCAAEPAKEQSAYDKAWSYANWYQNDENPVIQRLQFTGRFQGEYATLDADEGTHDEWNVRRLRLGLKAKAFGNFTLHGEADLNPQEAEPAYQRLTDAYVQWSQDKRLALTAGKHSEAFTLDGMTSSKELLTIDRNNLANNLWFTEEYIPGVSAGGQVDQWKYFAGAYSAGDKNKELGHFNGGLFYLGTLGYDFGKELGVKQAQLNANYVYQDEDPENTFTRSLEQVGSLNFWFDTGAWGFRSDLAAGQGYGKQSDLWGAVLMPFYQFTPKLQGVARVTHIESEDPKGVRLALYENQIVAGKGEQYDEGYLGLNYYFYGHKLKVQTGLQYAEMRDSTDEGGDYKGWSWVTGLRVGW